MLTCALCVVGVQSFGLNTSKKGDSVEADVKATYNLDPYTVEVTAAQSGKVGGACARLGFSIELG